MCKLKSSIILKDRIFIPDYDSHSQMLDELGIEDTEKNAETKFIRAELYPEDGDVFSPVDEWVYKAEQDILPDWYVASYDEQRVREAVKEWADKHIHIGKKNFSVNGGTHYFKNCENVTLCGDSTATLYGNSTATLCNNSKATLRDNSTATLHGNSTATLWDNSTATLWDNSTATLCNNSKATLCNNSKATLWGNGTAIAPNYSSVPKENIILSDNTTFKDCRTKTIYQSGDWKLEIVEGKND